MAEPLVLHEDPRSGNCYKIRLTAALLGVTLTSRHYDAPGGETRTPEFKAKVHAGGKIPVLQIGEGASARFLPESNAACWYLASESRLIPTDRFAQAEMLRWMFFEQYSHEPNVATLRVWLRPENEPRLSPAQRAQIETRRAAGDAALRLMNEHLAGRDWLVGDSETLADLVLYPYTSKAEDGGFALSDYPHVLRWLDRIESLPGYIPML